MLARHPLVWLGATLLAVLAVLNAVSAAAAQTQQPATSEGSSPTSLEPSHVLAMTPPHTAPAHWVEPVAPGALDLSDTAASTNWSGRLATGTTFSVVSGDWTVPSIRPTTTYEASATWIGVDGATASSSSSILQTGTAQLTENGQTKYYAWLEKYPSPAEVLFAVSPGDQIRASVSHGSGTSWQVSLVDGTSKSSASRSVTYKGPGDSAEWIEELPTASSGPQPYLTNFGSVEFTHVSDTAADPAKAVFTPVDMVDRVGHVISRAGSLSNGNFDITYVPEPTSTAVSASPATSTAGSYVTYSATIGSAGPAPTGSVTFSDGSVTLCTAGVSGGSGACSANNAPLGSDTVQGRYSGDANSTSSSGTTQVSISASTHGYWLVGSDGGIFTFGSAQFHGSTGNLVLQRPVVGITPTSDRGGYWLDASDGGIFAFGDAGFYGSLPGLGFDPAGSGLPNSLDAPIVGMVPSADGGGYFMVASDGGVFAFGDARFAGSCPGIGGCAGAAVAVMPDATGNGYWVVTQTGHVYAFGDAPYYGAPGPQSVPVTSAVRSPSGNGYMILFANGAIASYGQTPYDGCPLGAPYGGLNPASAIFTTSDGGGYWVATADGSVANCGDAPNDGSMAGTRLNGAIIAGTGW